MKHQKIRVGVEARFLTDGTLIPKTVFLGDQKFEITRAFNRGTQHPREVSCIAPTKYIIIVCSQMKYLYFEPSTMEWFTVKEMPGEA